MDGYDVRTWKKIEEKVVENKMRIEIMEESIFLYKNTKVLGGFTSTDILYNFICGYEAGLSDLISKEKMKGKNND